MSLGVPLRDGSQHAAIRLESEASGLTWDIVDPTAVVQTPYPPADLNARGVQRRAGASGMRDRSAARA
jgi:hypothetical protein